MAIQEIEFPGGSIIYEDGATGKLFIDSVADIDLDATGAITGLESLIPDTVMPTYNDGTTECYIAGYYKFAGEGSSSESSSPDRIASSTISVNLDEYKDDAGNLYGRLHGHMKHWHDSGTVYARIWHESAGSRNASEISVTANDYWDWGESGWIDLSAYSGTESFEIEIWTSSDTSGTYPGTPPGTVEYNSMVLELGVPV